MSEPAAPSDQTSEALSRLASYGETKKSPGSWGPLVLVVVLAIPLAAVGWVAWRQTKLQDELTALRADNAALQQLSATNTDQAAQAQRQMQEAQSQVEEARSQMQQAQRQIEAAQQQVQAATQRQQQLDASVQQTLEQQLAASNEAAAAQASQLASLEAELTEARARIDSLSTGGSPLAEAEVLLRFAQQRLALARDTATAIELYEQADLLLRNMNDPAVIDVRESIAREVGALRALPAVDVPGLFAQLSAQAVRVETLGVVSDATVQDFEVSLAAPQAAGSGWWDRAKQSLGEYFVVTRSTATVLPQMSAGDQFRLRALVQLQIEQAKLALLRSDSLLYQSALDTAIDTAHRWLRSDDDSFAQFITALETLRDTPIVVDIPASDRSLSALGRLSGTDMSSDATPPAPPTAGIAQ